MTKDELLALYDKEQRREITYPGFRREVVGSVIRFVDELPGGDANFILYNELTADNNDAVIAEQIAYFRENGRSWGWKYFSHDTPPNLLDRLAAHGLTIEEEEAIMALDLTQAPAELLQPVGSNVRRLTDAADVAQIVAIEEAVWGGDRSSWGERLAADMRNNPEYVSVYIAYAGDEPACAAWINFTPNSQFASLWGGSTQKEYRRKGLYTAVLAARVQEASQRGYRYLTIDASPMSRPIVTKHGFQLLTLSCDCTWKPDKAEG